MTLPAPQIKKMAHELGFDEVGITSFAKLEEGARAIREWVKEGRHGSMKYLEDFDARHAKFFQDFGEPKSVIVLGVNYYSNGKSHSSPSKDILQGRVARYAWGRDYHEVIRAKHEELIERLTKLLPARFKSCVDIQPVPERFAAMQAGFGFIGKNTMLLSQKFGPWVFLSEIVTNLKLQEDLPAEGDCGTCSHCQKVCPTGALDENYKIDARRCIAYLTIEHKGSIPLELRPHVKDWVFGCDECLSICPFTSKQKEGNWKELGPDAGFGEWLEIEKLFEIKSNSEYEKRFQGTAMTRTTRKQMMRNACVVLGNSGKKEAIPLLKKALHDPAPLVREHAAWALGRLQQAQ